MINLSERKIKHYKIAVIAISALVLLSALTHTAFYIGTTEKPEEVASLYAYLFGWLVVLGSGISWLANPFLLYSWIALFTNQRRAEWYSILAILLALSFLMLKEVVANEAGLSRTIVSYGNGYWLWLSSLVINCIGIFLTRIAARKAYTYRTPKEL